MNDTAEKAAEAAKKTDEKASAERVVIFRTTRTLRDKLAKKAAQNVIEGKHIGLGAGGTYSVNHTVTEIFASELGLEFKREEGKIKDSKSSRVGLSFLFPTYIYDALKDKSERDGVSMNELMQRILEKSTS